MVRIANTDNIGKLFPACGTSRHGFCFSCLPAAVRQDSCTPRCSLRLRRGRRRDKLSGSVQSKVLRIARCCRRVTRRRCKLAPRYPDITCRDLTLGPPYCRAVRLSKNLPYFVHNYVGLLILLYPEFCILTI